MAVFACNLSPVYPVYGDTAQQN